MTRAKDISKILTDADISGNIDVDGVTNLDVVDIDGAVDMSSTLQVDGAITSSANMTITGNVISNDGSNNARFQFDNNNQILIQNDSAMNFYVNGNNNLKIDSTGAITKPLQPSFLAFVANNSDNNNFAVGSNVTIVFGTEVFDRGANFASNTFTAPLEGLYQLQCNIRTQTLDSASSYYYINIITSNRNYINILDPDFGQDNSYFTFQLAVLADMDASDTAHVVIFQASGNQQTLVELSSSFSGYLVA